MIWVQEDNAAALLEPVTSRRSVSDTAAPPCCHLKPASLATCIMGFSRSVFAHLATPCICDHPLLVKAHSYLQHDVLGLSGAQLHAESWQSGRRQRQSSSSSISVGAFKDSLVQWRFSGSVAKSASNKSTAAAEEQEAAPTPEPMPTITPDIERLLMVCWPTSPGPKLCAETLPADTPCCCLLWLPPDMRCQLACSH